MVLDVMEGDKSYSPMEVTELFIKRYPDHKQVKKWRAYRADVCRYAIARYLTFLKNRGYIKVSPSTPKKLLKVRESPLLKEVAEAYIFLGKANSIEEAILKIAKEFISAHKTDFESLIENIGRAKKAIEREKETHKKALSSASQIMGKITQNEKEIFP